MIICLSKTNAVFLSCVMAVLILIKFFYVIRRLKILNEIISLRGRYS